MVTENGRKRGHAWEVAELKRGMNPAQAEMLEVLRGAPEDRPEFDSDLRHQLEDELHHELSDIDEELFVNKHKISQVLTCEKKFTADDSFEWNPNNARGTISHLAIELSSHNRKPMTPVDLVEQAMERSCERSDTKSIADYLREIGDAERADLRSQAVDRVVKFVETFPRIPHTWLPHAEATTAATVGPVVLRGKIDYKIGAPDGLRSGSVLVDFKTGAPWRSHLDDLRFYALLETLRLGTPPFRWVNVYLDSGRAQHENATVDTLRATVKRVGEAARRIAELDLGRKPEVTPGLGCRFCPLLASCAPGREHEAQAAS